MRSYQVSVNTGIIEMENSMNIEHDFSNAGVQSSRNSLEHTSSRESNESMERTIVESLDAKKGLDISRPSKIERQFSVAQICSVFLKSCKEKVNGGDLSPRSFDDYANACDAIVSAFGLNRSADDIRPSDFAILRKLIAKDRRPKTVENWIARCRTVINFANANELTERPICFGSYFAKPKARVLRQDRRNQPHRGQMDLRASQIRDLLSIASPQMHAMILLGVNTGIGNADLGRMEFHDLDLDLGWMDYPRHKTGVIRRSKLWTETVEAIKEAIAIRADPKDQRFSDTVFITGIGKRWFNEASSTNPISQAFRKLLKRSGHYVQGVGFYALRRTFETVVADTMDQPAIDLSMGHERQDMASIYRQRLGDQRLVAVSEHVRKWLFEIPDRFSNIGFCEGQNEHARDESD